MKSSSSNDRNVSFQVQSRPLRIVCVVRDMTDVTAAITLHTHLWGGSGNSILSLPDEGTTKDKDDFFACLERIDPDYILLPNGIQYRRSPNPQQPIDLLPIIEEIKARYEPRLASYSADGAQQFGALQGWMGCPISTRHGSGTGYLLPNSLVLSHHYKEGLGPEKSRIILPADDDPFGFYLRIKSGISCPEFAEYLDKILSATRLHATNNFIEMMQAQLLCCGRATPISITTNGCKFKSTNFSAIDEMVFFRRDVVGLYLCEDDVDIRTICSFWNSRGPSSSKSLILPRREFADNLESSMEVICTAFEDIKGIYLVTKDAEETQTIWHDQLNIALSKIGKELPIKIISSGYHFPFYTPRAAWGNPITMSRPVRNDNSVLFTPPIPPAHDKNDEGYAFACEIEVTLEGGRKLNLPPTIDSAILLSRELESIETFEKNGQWGIEFLRDATSVRPSWHGLTLITSANTEAYFFLPTDNTIVNRNLALHVDSVRANRQTRYAQGIMNLLGGYAEMSRFVHNGGLNVLQTLCGLQARQCGLVLPHLQELLNHGHSLRREQRKELNEEYNRHLEALLNTGLVRRGFALECPHCDLKEWLSVDALCEKITCPGCAQEYSLPFNNPAYYYKANELANRCLVDSGGKAVLLAASALSLIENSGCIQFGAELSKSGESDVEVDLVWMVSDTTILFECKSLQRIEEAQTQDIRDSLAKTIQAALLTKAQIVVLAVATPVTDTCSLHEIVYELQEVANSHKLGLHLLINDRLYVRGTEAKVRRMNPSLSELLHPEIKTTQAEPIQGLGDWPKRSMLNTITGINETVIKAWLQQFSAPTA